jgi:thymidylate synthase
MNNLDKQYQALLKDILSYGNVKNDRTGTGTKSIFGYMIHHNMRDGFPLLTTKKVPFKTMATELMWFLMGDTNIKYLVDNNCNIWNGDAYKSYVNSNEVAWPMSQDMFIDMIRTDEEFAKKWGELGPIYGKQWRAWGRKNVINYDLENVKSSDRVKVMDLIRDGGDYSKYDVKVTYQNNSIDQIAILINELKTNPDSRRLMVSAWNVGDLNLMVLPPCHYGFQVYTRELTFNERYKLYSKSDIIWEEDGGNTYGKISALDIMDDNNIPTRAISLSWNQRSVDVFLGLPFNIASYGLLLEMIAREVNMVPEHLIGNLGDTHLYLNHLEQAEQQLERIPRDLPVMKMSSGHNFRAAMANKADEIDLDDFMLVGYDPHPTIKAPLSN